MAALLVLAAGWAVLRTEWFREQLRRRVIAELERATGARVELAVLRFDPGAWRVRLEGLRIHGSEPAGQPPLAAVEAIEADLHVASFLRRDVDVRALRVMRPEIHIAVAADGSTNFPPRPSPEGRLFTEPLLELAVGEFEVRGGALWWNDRRYGLEGALRDLRAQVTYGQPGLYDGRITAGRSTISSEPPLPPIEQVQTRFRLLRDRIEILDASVRTAHSEARVSGSLDGLRQPRWNFRYDAVADARDFHPAPVTAGRFRFTGTAEGQSRRWTARGRLDVQQLAVAAPEFRASGIAASGDYHADTRKLELPALQVRLLGGRWTGRVSASPSKLELNGRVEDVRLEEILRAVAAPSRPLDQLRWTGFVRGALEARASWPLSLRSLSVNGDWGAAGGSLEGAARVSWRGDAGELEISELSLRTVDTGLTGAGRISRRGDASVRFQLRATRLDELTRIVLAATGRRVEASVRLEAPAHAQGSLSGTVDRPELSATVDVGAFVLEGRRWDSFRGAVRWSLDRAAVTGGRLVQGKAVISVNASARLSRGEFTDDSPFQADVGIRETSVEDLTRLAGVTFPVTGIVTAQAKLSGARKDPRGAGSVEIRRGTAWEEPFEFLRATVLLEGAEVRASTLRLTKAKGGLSGSGSYHTERRTFRFELRGERFWPAKAPWRGSAEFGFAGSGRLSADHRLEALTGQGAIQVQGLVADGQKLGDATATVRAAGDRLRIELQSSLLGAKMTAQGEVAVQAPFAVTGQAEFKNLDLASAAAAAHAGGARITGSADGALTFAGDLQRPDAFRAEGAVTRLDLILPAAEGGSPRTLRSAEPVAWRLAARKVSFERVHLAGEGSDLRAAGSVDLRAPGAIQGSLQGTINLAVLGILPSGVTSDGIAALNITAGGTWREPNLSGKIEVRDGALEAEDAPLGITKANGVILFNRRRATIQKMTAEVGGGEVSLAGDGELGAGVVSYRLRADARRVRLRYPRGLTTLLDASLTLSGANRRSRLEGRIEITRAGTRSSVDLATLIEALKEPPRTPSTNQWLQGAQLNVAIESAPNVRFDTSLARNLQADVSLRLRGTLLNPALLGRINITQGEIDFQGTRYTLNRGDISFANPFRIEPILNLDLETRVSGYDIVLTLIGPLQKLNVTYRSDPPLTFNEMVTLLAVGRAPSIDPTLAAQQTSQALAMTQIGADTIVGQAISRPVAGRLQRFFGVSRLKVDPELVGPEGTATARITLEQQVGRDVTFTYTYNLASAQEQIIRVRWAINRQWSLEAVRDQNGLVGLDVLYKKRFR